MVKVGRLLFTYVKNLKGISMQWNSFQKNPQKVGKMKCTHKKESRIPFLMIGIMKDEIMWAFWLRWSKIPKTFGCAISLMEKASIHVFTKWRVNFLRESEFTTCNSRKCIKSLRKTEVSFRSSSKVSFKEWNFLVELE